MQKKKYSSDIRRHAAYLFGIGLVCTAFMVAIWHIGGVSLSVFHPHHTMALAVKAAEAEKEPSQNGKRHQVILDAGHGGEDGGALSSDGVAEKTLNLSVTKRLGTMLEAAGVEVIYTRTDDNGLYDGAIKGHRKMTDLKNRLAVAKAFPDAIFLSLHMNTFQMEKYHGAQLFYTNNEQSKALATLMQERIKEYLQPDNTRMPKAADTSIFLLAQNEGCAVLAECGFLSNKQEAKRLSDGVYQEKLAAVLCASLLEFLGEK